MRQWFSLSIVSVVFLVWSLSVHGSDFNCQDECGLYKKGDDESPDFHKLCEAMDEKRKCKKKYGVKKRKKKVKKKQQGTRIVGGDETKNPMPWMVFIKIGESQCGGSLINSQFVLTAAHCFCYGALSCSSDMGKVVDKPITITNEKEIPEKVTLYVGLTKEGGKGLEPNIVLFANKKIDEDYHIHPAKKIFINPLLGSGEKFINSPDQALIMMEGKIDSFADHIRPICLPKEDTKERPSCPDNSRDKKKQTKNKATGKPYMKTIRGGCATVAGWGHRYSNDMYMEKEAPCQTDYSTYAPSKVELCLNYWTTGNNQEKEYYNCTKDKFKSSDIAEPCKLLSQELTFNKKLGKEKAKMKKYFGKTLDGMIMQAKAPMEVFWKYKNDKGKKRIKKYKCGPINHDKIPEEDRGKNGYCATELEEGDTEKIKSWGFCNDACMDEKDGFMIANLNILNDEECEILFKNREKKKNSIRLEWNKEYEICTGKKHQFPKSNWRFLRKKKSNKTLVAEKAIAKEFKFAVKPTKYEYIFKKSKKKFDSLKTPRKYPYDWFLGGVDSCQGDSGGPLWRNIKEGDKVRATQIGTVSRGDGCADFNAPAIFGSVKKALSWIKEVVEKEMKGKGYCPKKKS